MAEDPKNILLVEDDAVIALSETHLLTGAGYTVIRATTGEKAIAAAREAKGLFDLILMDIDLGRGMDGTQAAQEILKDYDIPVLFLSSHTEKEITDKTDNITSYGYVVKNSGDLVLLASIKMAFRLHRAHRALKESADQFTTVTSTSMEGFLVVDTHTRILDANEAYSRMVGYTRDELLTMSISDIDVADRFQGAVFDAGLIHPAGPDVFESRHRHKHGRTIDVEISSTFIRGQGRYLVFVNDITHRKQAEARLRESEDRFRSVWDKSADGMRLTDREGRIVDVNEAYCRIVKMPRENLIGSVFSVTYTSQGTTDDLGIYRQRFDSGHALSRLSAPVELWNGEVIDLEISSSIVETEIHGRMFLSMFRDITARKVAQEQLATSELQYRTLVEGMSDAVMQVDNADIVTFVNKQFCDFTGYTKDEVLGKVGYELLFDEADRRTIREKNRSRLDGKTDIYEIRLRRKDGETRWVRISGAPVFNRPGEVTGSIGVIADITERQRAEEALKVSEQRYRDLIEKMPDGVYRSSHEGKFLEVNPAMVTMLGYGSKEELMAIHIPSQLYFAPTDRESAALEEKLEEMAVFRLKKKDGSEVWVEDHGRHVLDAQGNILYHEGIMRDVTTRKLAEDQLAMHARLLAATLDSVLLLDPDGRIVYANQAAYTDRGYTEKEILGMNIRDLNAEEDSRTVTDRMARILREGRLSFTTVQRTKTGETIDVEVNAGVITMNERVYILSAQRDITIRKRAEEALQRLLVHNEVLLKELQHRVKNNLNIISGLLNLELPELSDEKSRRVFIEAQGRIRSMSLIYEQLYSSNSLAQVDLRQYIVELSHTIVKSYALDPGRVDLTTDIADLELDMRRAVPLGLILNELLSNALKYAYPSPRRGEIRIALRLSGETITLCVADNGIGLPEGFSIEAAQSLGMRLVAMLVDQIEGTLSLDGSRGTAVTIVFPLAQEEDSPVASS